MVFITVTVLDVVRTYPGLSKLSNNIMPRGETLIQRWRKYSNYEIKPHRMNNKGNYNPKSKSYVHMDGWMDGQEARGWQTIYLGNKEKRCQSLNKAYITLNCHRNTTQQRSRGRGNREVQSG